MYYGNDLNVFYHRIEIHDKINVEFDELIVLIPLVQNQQLDKLIQFVV